MKSREKVVDEVVRKEDGAKREAKDVTKSIQRGNS